MGVGQHAGLCITTFKFDISLVKKTAAQMTVTFIYPEEACTYSQQPALYL